MRKVLFCLLLLIAVYGLSASFAGAQAKKAPDTATIEIAEGKDGKFRFFVRDEDEKLLAMSGPPAFATEKEAREAALNLQKLIAKAKIVVKKEDTKDKDKK
jgi:hypothetical protein